MMTLPDDHWKSEMVQGHEMGNGLSDAVNASMGKAFTMAKGKVPKAAWNPAMLGEVAAPSLPPSDSAKSMQSGNRTPVPQYASAPGRAGKADVPRPKRNVKKRSYGDTSYEGYGEGYVDDENQDIGYSTGDGEERAGRKRPKKVGSMLISHFLDPWLTNMTKTAPHSFQSQGPMRQNSSYGPGMVGV